MLAAYRKRFNNHPVSTNETEPYDFKWLVESRSKIQKESLALYNFLCANRTALDQNKPAAEIFGFLLGTTFSLWRAAFLANENRPKRRILDDAQKFLKYLVRDNTISYTQDKDAKNWTVGYYLNDARYRLLDIKHRLPKLVGDALQGLNPLFEKLEKMYSSGREIDATTQVWNVEYKILHKALRVFRTAIAPKDQPHTASGDSEDNPNAS